LGIFIRNYFYKLETLEVTIVWFKKILFRERHLNKLKKFEIPVIFQTTQTKQFFFVPNFDKILGCYRLPPLKEISSSRFEEARKVEGFRVLGWLPPLKETFVDSLGL
jgi:hypothetical protein